MTRKSRVRVQCPNCGMIKDSRGEESFNCEECSMRWKIEPNKFQQKVNKNSEHKQTDGQDNGRHKPSGNMGKTGQQDSGGGEDKRESTSNGLENKTDKPKRGTLNL